MFDTREYDIEFTDGAIERYTVNVIAVNVFAQVNEEGNMYLILQEIVDHKKDNSAVPMAEGMYRMWMGSERNKVTTRGWSLLVGIDELGEVEGPENVKPGHGSGVCSGELTGG